MYFNGRTPALALAALMILGGAPASAQQNGSLTSKVELEKLSLAADGVAGTKIYVEPKVVVPGDRIRVTLTFSNNGTTPALGINITNPIPEGLVFDGTDDTVDFGVSVDGSKSFGALEMLTMAVAGATPRAATMADVTHVRWLWSDAVAPKQTRSVSFFGRVK